MSVRSFQTIQSKPSFTTSDGWSTYCKEVGIDFISKWICQLSINLIEKIPGKGKSSIDDGTLMLRLTNWVFKFVPSQVKYYYRFIRKLGLHAILFCVPLLLKLVSVSIFFGRSWWLNSRRNNIYIGFDKWRADRIVDDVKVNKKEPWITAVGDQFYAQVKKDFYVCN